MKYEKAKGTKVIISNMFMNPHFSASKLIKGSKIPITPQLKPPMNPEIILLNSGINFCANAIFTGDASKLKYAIKIKDNNPIIPIPLFK